MSKKRAGAPTPEDLLSDKKKESDREELNRLEKEYKETFDKLKEAMAESGAKKVEGKNVEMKKLKEIVSEPDEETKMEKIRDMIPEKLEGKESGQTKLGETSNIIELAEKTVDKFKKYKAKKKEIER